MLEVWIDEDGDVNWNHVWMDLGQEERLYGGYLKDRRNTPPLFGPYNSDLSLRWMILT